MSKPFTTYIDFKSSMGLDERDDRYCVLREKVLDKRGLFPSADFEPETLSNGFEPQKLIYGSGNWAIGKDDNHDIAFYSINTGSSFSETYRGGHASDDLADAIYYNDGVSEDLIYGIDTSGDVFTFNTSTYIYTSGVHTSFATGGGQLVQYHPSTDNLYYISGYKIYKQNGTTFSGTLKTLPNNFTYKKMIAYKDWMLIIAENNTTNEINAFFYDIINEPNFFDNNKFIGFGNYLGGGVLEGVFTCLISVNQRFNSKEQSGGIQIKQFNGSQFKLKNSLKAIRNQVHQSNRTHNEYCDGGYLYIGFNDWTIYPGIYRINVYGEVVSLGKPDNFNPISNSGKFICIIKYMEDMVVGYKENNGEYKLAQISDYSGSENDLREPFTYIEGFHGDTTVTKQLRSFTVSFTMTEINFNEEVVKVYYRIIDPYNIDNEVDEINSWTQILEYDYDIDGQADIKTVTMENAINTLPEYKEIEFKITGEKGANITGAKFQSQAIKDDIIDYE